MSEEYHLLICILIMSRPATWRVVFVTQKVVDNQTKKSLFSKDNIPVRLQDEEENRMAEVTDD